MDLSCENCKYCDVWSHTNDYACFSLDCDWEIIRLYNENDIQIGVKFDPSLSFSDANDCDFYEYEE